MIEWYIKKRYADYKTIYTDDVINILGMIPESYTTFRKKEIHNLKVVVACFLVPLSVFYVMRILLEINIWSCILTQWSTILLMNALFSVLIKYGKLDVYVTKAEATQRLYDKLANVN